MMTLTLAVCMTALFLLVIFLDLTKYIIPNWLVLAVLGLYPIALINGGYQQQDWLWALGIAVIMFFAGFLVFSLRWMGGGDVKLLAVCGLWAGKEAVTELLIYTGLIGGLLGLAIIVARPVAPWILGKFGIFNMPKVLEHNAPLPYGIAISATMLILIWSNALVVL